MIFNNIFSEVFILIMAFTRVDYHDSKQFSISVPHTYMMWILRLTDHNRGDWINCPLRRLVVSIMVYPILYASDLQVLLVAPCLIEQYWYSSRIKLKNFSSLFAIDIRLLVSDCATSNLISYSAVIRILSAIHFLPSRLYIKVKYEIRYELFFCVSGTTRAAISWTIYYPAWSSTPRI